MPAKKIDNLLDLKKGEVPVWFATGESLKEIRDHAYPEDVAVVVTMNGTEVPECELDLVQPGHGDHVTMVPKLEDGDDDKGIIGAIAFIALAVAAPAIAGGALGGIGFAGPAWLGEAAVMVAGGILINSIMGAPPKAGRTPDYDSDGSPTHKWNPETTQRQGYVIPKIYGRTKMFGNVIAAWRQPYHPDEENLEHIITGITKADPAVVTSAAHGFANGDIVYVYDVLGMTEVNGRVFKVANKAADTFQLSGVDSSGYTTYTEGGTVIEAWTARQTLYTIIALGQGPIEGITQVKLNDKEVEYLSSVSIEKRLGVMEPEAVQHFDHCVIEKSVQSKVRDAGDPAEASTVQDFMDELSMNVVFPYGVHDNLSAHTVSVKGYYREHNAAAWATLIDADVNDDRSDGLTMSVPALSLTRGKKYDVKLEKTSTDEDSGTFGDEVYLETVKERLNVAFLYPGLAACAIKALATDQLSGTIRFSAIVEGAIVQVGQDNSASVTGISKAASAVVTVGSGHGFTTGDYALFKHVRGMTEINDRFGRVTGTAATTITVNIDSSSFSTYTGGGTAYEFALEWSNNPAWVCFDILTDAVISGGDGGKFDADDLQEDDLVVWYKLDDNAANATVSEEVTGGANYDGEMQSGGVADNTEDHDQTGYIDGALEFDGTDDKIVIPDAASDLDITGDLTISFHIYPHRLNNIIFENRFKATGAKPDYGYHVQTDNAGRLSFQFGNGVDEAYQQKSSTPIILNQWNYVVIVKRNATVYFYIDGVFAGSDWEPIDTIAYDAGSTDRLIGTSADALTYSGTYGFGSNQYADMYLDNLKVWNVALTWEQIQGLSGANPYEVERYDGRLPSRINIETFQDWADHTAVAMQNDDKLLTLSAITQATQAVVTTSEAHNLAVGDTVVFRDVAGMVEITDGTTAEVAAVGSSTTFTIDLDTSGYTAFTSGTAQEIEKRVTFNGAIDGETSRWEAALRVCETGRAMLVWNGLELSVTIDKASSPVQMFSMGNIIQSSFNQAWIPQADRASEIEVHFHDEDQDYEKRPLPVFNRSIDNPSNIMSLEAVGVTVEGEVEGLIDIKLKQNELLKQKVEFEVEIDSIACTIGDVIYVQHDMPNWGAIGSGDDAYCGGGRIASANLAGADDIVTLDCDVSAALEGGTTYEIMVRLADDTIETKEIKSVSGAAITVDGSFSGSPAAGDTWALGEQNLVTKLFRIQGIERTSDQTAKIEALEYDATVYAVETEF